MVMEWSRDFVLRYVFYHKTKSHSGLCIPAYQKGGSTLSICAFMVRDIKKKMKIILFIKDVFPNEIEVNLFIFRT
jgi:hypothetical protein